MRVPVGIRRFSCKRTEHRRLPFPASPNLRVAHVTATTSFDDVEAFPRERWRELETYRPRILVGPVSDLQKLVERVELGRVDVRSVDHVVFVLTECGDRPISDPSRVVLWQTFGVPVIELLAGADGIRRGLRPDPARDTDGAAVGRLLPSDLGRALDALEADALLVEGLGPELVRTFVALKRTEVERERRHVGDWDWAEYAVHS